MAKKQLLNNVEHASLRIITRRAAEYGDAVGGCMLLPSEFVEAQRHYPIFFQTDGKTNDLMAVAIFGFDSQENLFLTENGWDVEYIPLIMLREPFFIGMAKEAGDAGYSVLVDVDHPRISNTEGLAVFSESGGYTGYLDYVRSILMSIHTGLGASKSFIAQLKSLDLIEPFVWEVEFSTGLFYRSSGYYTINQEKLYQLDGNTIASLHATGALMLIYMMLASLKNIPNLVNRKNIRLKEAQELAI